MLSIRHIVKEYAAKRALNDVSIEIEQGTIYGLLGPNGAGKTSLIRIVNQITAPDSGEIFFNGRRLDQDHIDRIGYLPEERGLYKKMEIGEQLIYLARLKGLSEAEAKRRIKYWFEKLGIESWWNKKIEELSKGMQQKAQFVSTVLHEPDLIILDEPFSGFDPINAEQIKNEIIELNRKGATVILSTHRMESVEELCDSIALLNLSNKILDGKVKEIRNAYRNNTYRLQYSGAALADAPGAPFTVVEDNMGDDGRKAKLKLNTGVTPNEALAYLIPRVAIHSMVEVIPDMNEIFIKTIQNNLSHE